MTILIMVLSLLAAVAGCEDSSRGKGTEPTAAARQTVQSVSTVVLPPTATPGLPVGGDVVYGEVSASSLLDPLHPSPSQAGQHPQLVWESLLEVDPENGILRPALAREWDVSADGLTVRFYLREDVSWHDGQPFRADDVRATFNAIRAAGSGSFYQANLVDIAEVDQLNDHTIQLTLAAPRCAVLYDVGLVPILPARLLAGDPAQPPAEPIGSGPFRVTGQGPDGAVILEPYGGYRSPARLDRLTYVSFPSADALLEGWQAGDVDVACFPAEFEAPVDTDGRGDVTSYPGDEYLLVIFNTDRGPLTELGVRQALRLALDREAIAARTVPTAGATLLSTTLLSSHWALWHADVQVPPYDRQGAGQLLSDAGWIDEDGDGMRTQNGRPLSLDVVTNGENGLRSELATLVAQSYRAIGVESEVHIVEWGILLDILFRHDFDVAVLGWRFPLDPDQTLWWHSSETETGRGFNLAGWEDDRVDDLLTGAATLPGCFTGERAPLYAQLMQLMVEESPIDPLFVPHRRLAVREGVVGVAPSPFAGPLWNALEWYVAK